MRRAVREAARATVYLAKSVALSVTSYLFITVLLITATGAVAVIGIGLLPETVLLIRRLAGVKREMVADRTGREIPEAYVPITGRRVRERVRTAIHDPGTRTDAIWLLAYYLYGNLGLLAVPLWVIGLPVDGVWCGLLRRRPVVLPLIGWLATLDADGSRILLRPSPQARLAERVEQLAATRADAIVAHGAELRRIERDLHDGTQARLVSLSMRLGLAKRALDRDPRSARALLDVAQDLAEEALTDLRHVVRGIHPPILTDRGLDGAVRALAASSALTVTVEIDGVDDPRAPAAIEAAAYYIVAEALANAAKHSGSDRAEVRLARTPKGVGVVVRDDGRGGATGTGEGTGLLGIQRRAAALDGSATVTSPPGGPTVIEAELPCVW